jgi:hypothetical protein
LCGSLALDRAIFLLDLAGSVTLRYGQRWSYIETVACYLLQLANELLCLVASKILDKPISQRHWARDDVQSLQRFCDIRQYVHNERENRLLPSERYLKRKVANDPSPM